MSDTSTVSLAKSSAPPQPSQDPQLLPEPRRCRAGAGVVWLTSAFEMFKKNIGLWLGMTFTMMIIIFALSVIPFIGILIGMGSILFMGGMIKAAAAQERGEALRFNYLFSAFETHLKPLLILMLLYILGFAAISGIMLVFFFSFVVDSTFNSMLMTDGFNAKTMLMFNLFSLILSVPMIALMMCMWFAPPLIVLHNLSPTDAMKQSFKASLRNWLPMLVLGMVFGAIGILLMIFTLGIGIFLAMPVMLLIYYTSYRDVWTDQPLSVS